jgi:hypothetical protein
LAKRPRGIKLRNTGGAAKGAKQFARFTLEEDTITPTLKALPGYLDKIVATTFRYYEPRLENHAKLNAPWTDRTTNARNGLIARAGRTTDVHYIVLAHQVPYGIYLETRWEAKYAIIMPTIEKFGPEIMDTIQKILDKRLPSGGVS